MKTCFTLLFLLFFQAAFSQAPLPHYEFHPCYQSAYNRALRHPDGNYYTFGTALLGNYVNWPVSQVRLAAFDSAGTHLFHQSAPAFNFENGRISEAIVGLDSWLNCTGNSHLCDVVSEEGFLIQMSPDGMTFRTRSFYSGITGSVPVFDIIQRPDSHFQLASTDMILVVTQTGDSLYQIAFPHGRIEEILPWNDRMIVFANQTYITDTGYHILDSFPNCPQANRSEWLDAAHFVVYHEAFPFSGQDELYVMDTSGSQTGYRLMNEGEAWCIDSGKVLICDSVQRRWYAPSLNLLYGNMYPGSATFHTEGIAAGPDKIMIAGTSGPMNEGCQFQWRNGGSISLPDDVDILSVRIDSVVVYPYNGWPGVCDLQLNVHVKVKNAGSTVLNSFGVKCRTVGGGMCGPLFWDSCQTGINLSPGDSVEVLLGRITDITLSRPYLYQYNLHVMAGAANDHFSQDGIFDEDSAGFDTTLMVVNRIAEQESAFRVFPNPVSGPLRIELLQPHTTPLEISLFNAEGRLMLQQTVPEDHTMIDMGYLPSGMYLLHLQAGNEESWEKLIRY